MVSVQDVVLQAVVVSVQDVVSAAVAVSVQDVVMVPEVDPLHVFEPLQSFGFDSTSHQFRRLRIYPTSSYLFPSLLPLDRDIPSTLSVTDPDCYSP